MDIVVCSALGADMYDSVYPTRTARFGVALVPDGTLKLKNSEYVEDFRCACGAVQTDRCLHAVCWFSTAKLSGLRKLRPPTERTERSCHQTGGQKAPTGL